MRDQQPANEDYEPDELEPEDYDEPPGRRKPRNAGGGLFNWRSLALGMLLGVWLGGDGGD